MSGATREILKPCPFCNGWAALLGPRQDTSVYDRYIVECCNCEVFCGAETREDAIAAWNTRTTPDALDATRQRAVVRNVAEIEADFDRAGAYMRSQGWPDDHGPIGYAAVRALLASYGRLSSLQGPDALDAATIERVAKAIRPLIEADGKIYWAFEYGRPVPQKSIDAIAAAAIRALPSSQPGRVAEGER